jgi:hypothetical protein
MEETRTDNQPDPGARKLAAERAWILPTICWLISVVVNLLHMKAGAIANFALAAAQLVLLIVATYTGVKVLTDKDPIYSKNEKKHAIVGLTMVGLTLLLIVVAIGTL